MLIERHGPMVLHVAGRRCANRTRSKTRSRQPSLCWCGGRALSGSGTLWVPGSGVACRVSRHSRKLTARRAIHESRAARDVSSIDSGSLDQIDDRDAGCLLHEELNRLPRLYRTPLVLCYLEGMTHQQAAHLLRCPVGTVRRRLARGREHLRARLQARGVTSAVGLTGPAYLGLPTVASLPCRLIESTVTAALSLSRSGSYGTLSAAVFTLLYGVHTTMFLTKIKVLAAGLLLLCLAGAGAVALARQDAAPRAEAPGDRAAGIRASDDADPRNGATHEVRPPGGREADYIRDLQFPDPHEIIVPPGSNLLIRIETKEGNLIHCAATVESNGRLQLKQNTFDRNSGGRIETSTAVTSIVISPSRAKSAASDRTGPVPSGAQPSWEARLPGPTASSDHERRLRDLEQKLDRVLRVLEPRSVPPEQPKSVDKQVLPR